MEKAKRKERKHHFKKMDPRMTASALLGIINPCTFRRLTLLEETFFEASVPFVMNIFLEGVKIDAQ